jgi:hypothetical protein
MLGTLSNKTVSAYARTYSSPDDIDMWSAGISETSLPGSMVGPTFACIIGKQFHNFRLVFKIQIAIQNHGNEPYDILLPGLAIVIGTRTAGGLAPSPWSS